MIPTTEQIEQINDINLINATIPETWKPRWECLTFEQREAILGIPDYMEGALSEIDGTAISVCIVIGGHATIYLVVDNGDVVSETLF